MRTILSLLALSTIFGAAALATATAQAAGDVGLHSSITLNSLGNPAISYYDATNKSLKLAICRNPSCTPGATPETQTKILTLHAAPGMDLGQYTSIANMANGDLVISYYDATHTALRMYRCWGADCAFGSHTEVYDGDNYEQPGENRSDVGTFSSITVGTDNVPILAAYHNRPGAFKELAVVHCGTEFCSAPDYNYVDNDIWIDAGEYTAIEIGNDGLPVISYFNGSQGRLRVAHCADTHCSTMVGKDIDSVPVVGSKIGLNARMAIGNTGPVIAYRRYDGSTNNTGVAICADAACNSVTKFIVGGSASNYSVAIGANSFPVISYDSGASVLGLLCANDTCSSRSVATLANSTSTPRQDLTIDADGHPVLSHYNWSSKDLYMTHCNDEACSTRSPKILDQ